MRDAIVRVARAMNGRGLNQGTSGNVSGRSDPGMLITPSGVPYDRLEPGRLVARSRTPRSCRDREMAAVLDRFQDYRRGRRAGPAASDGSAGSS
jgi:hypothetical protein